MGALHPALQADGRETLADTVPRERIVTFTSKMQAERARLAERLEKLQKRHAHVQGLADQVNEKLRQFRDEDGVCAVARSIAREHARAETELLPSLCACVPPEGADAHAVIDEEKRAESVLEGLKQVCSSIA